VDHVLEAMHKLRRELPELAYTIVGDGGDRPRLEALARSLRVDQRVTFAGWQNHFELAEAYRACDVFVLPSAQEGFGLVFLEAMATGKPVLAARAGAVPEVVVDGETGVLVDYGDVDALAAAILRLSRDAGLRRTLGEAGRKRFLEQFSFEQATNRVGELVRERSPERV
jgi:glycosyltransferase involved in cell wall biosynthesis